MSFITLIVSLGLAAVASATVVPKPAPTLTVYHEDLLQFNLTDLFSYGAGVSCTSVDGAKYTKPWDDIDVKDITNLHIAEQPEIVQFINNNSLVAVFDNSNVYIQNVNLDHETFGTTFYKPFGTPGAESVCSDVAYNKYTDRIFITCFAKKGGKTDKTTLYLYEINAADGTTVGTYQNTLDDDTQKLVHRANVMLVPLIRGRDLDWGLIVYDQGISSGTVTTNKWVWVLSGARTDALTDLGVVNFDKSLLLNTIYDMFHHYDGILVTGKTGSTPDSPFQIAYCHISVAGTASVSCDSHIISTPFKTIKGYVGVFNTGQYVEINADDSHPEADLIHICNFQGKFGESNFIDTKACSSITSFKIPDGVEISVVEGNIHQIAVQYTHYDSTYAGYSIHNFDMQFEVNDIDDKEADHLIPLGKSLIRVNNATLKIHRMVPPYFFIKAEDLKSTQVNKVRVQCTDNDSKDPVVNVITLTKLDSLLDGVVLNKDKIPDFSVYDGGRFMFQIDSDVALGNDLSAQVSFDPAVQQYAKAQVYDTEFVNIDWRTTNSSQDFLSIHFSGRHAVTLDRKGWVSFHYCFFKDVASIICIEETSFSFAGRNLQLKKDVNTVYNWLFAWAVDKDLNLTIIFIHDGINKKLYVDFRRGAADDCAMTDAGDFAYQVCAYAQLGLVTGHQYTPNNPETGIPVPTIDIGMSGRDWFCPQDVDFDPQVDNILEVLSVCPGKDQRIIRYKYPPANDPKTGELVLRLISSIPINFAYQNVQYCSMGTEFVVYSSLNGKKADIQSYNTVDDLNSWKFGTQLDDLNLGEIRDFNCVPRAGVFSTVSLTSESNIVSLAVYWGNNQGQANHRAYHVKRDSLEPYKFIDSYEFEGQVIHTLYDASTHSYNFMVSFTKGAVVDVHLEPGAISAVGPTGTINLNIDIRNSKSKVDTIVKTIEIVNASQTVKVSTTSKKLDSEASGIINLEDYITITGPLAGVELKKNVRGVKLIDRLRPLGRYTPGPLDFGTYSLLQTVGSTTIGVRKTESNSSTMYVFHNIEDFVGQYNPAHGVGAFHFAPLLSDPDHSVLVAYSTAEPQWNSLQIVVLKDAQRIAIGGSAFGQVNNFTMVRVIQLATTDKDSFLVLGMNGDDHVIKQFLVTFQDGRVTVADTEKSTPNVHDFGIASPANSDKFFVVYNVQGDFKHVTIDQFDKKTGAPASSLKMEINLSSYQLSDDFLKYEIVSLFAKEHNETAFYVVFNTASPYIFEYIYDTANNFKNPASFKYMKMPGHDGRFMDGNKQNIVMLTFGDLPSGDAGARFIFYNRQCQTNNGSIYPVWTYHYDQPRPFSLTNCQHNMSHFQFATPFDTAPLHFFHMSTMQLNVTNSSRLKDVVLYIDAAAHVHSSELNLSVIINGGGGGGDDGKKSSMAWWPFVLVIGVLILLAVGFIIYKAQKDKAMEADDPENYISLKPESKDAKARDDDQ